MQEWTLKVLFADAAVKVIGQTHVLGHSLMLALVSLAFSLGVPLFIELAWRVPDVPAGLS